MQNTLPFIILHISTLLTLILLIIVLRMKNKKTLHYFTISTVFFVLLWGIGTLMEQYAIHYFSYKGMLFTNIYFTAVSFIPVSFFLMSYSFAYSTILKKQLYLLCIIPILSVVLIWTNDLHHLFFVKFSTNSAEIEQGVYLIGETIFSYVFNFTALYIFIYYSIKNSGFFSKQSIAIFIGALFPILVDIIFVTKILDIPLYMETVAYSIGVFFFIFAINRFGFLNIVPIALQTVVDHISDSYIVVNDQNEIIDYNRPFHESFRGIAEVSRKDKLEDLLKKLDHMSFVKYDGFMESIKEAIDLNKSLSFENQYVSSGFDKTFTIEITPVFTRNSYKGTVILLKDITEQKKSFEMIRQTQVMLIESEHMASLGQLVGGIAHNLKTPIMSISGGLVGLSDLIDEYEESVEDKSITAEDHHEIAAEMRTWIGKLKEYTGYMSDIISTVKGQAVQLTASTTDSFTLRELIKRVDILMNHELKKYGCKLNVHCEIDLNGTVRGEINSFVQVINNLIINGIEAYEGREGVIEFNISRDENEQMTRFEVKDYGSGMTDEVKNKLFKEMITTKAKNGTGLGLYMSYSTITGRFGGRMWFESVCGMGTSFYIMIPAV